MTSALFVYLCVSLEQVRPDHCGLSCSGLAIDVQKMASVYTPARRRVPRLVKSDTTQFPRMPPKCVLVKHLRSYVCHVVTRRYLF